jgi:gliding motility-associated-like protein
VYVLQDNGFGADDFGANIPGSGTIKIATAPLHGTVIIKDNGTPGTQADDYIEYTPNPDFNGVDSLVYKIFDAVGLNDKAVVVITVLSVNDNPKAVNDSVTFEETMDEQIIDVTLNDNFGGDGASTTAITIIDMPQKGMAVVNDNGTAADPTDDYIVYTLTIEGSRKDWLTYMITDIDGDTSVARLDITILPNDVKVPQGFSPNGDGINDKLVIKGLSEYPNHRILIFNRWGNKVYEASPYKNDWDGKNQFGVHANGDALPDGTYFYILELGPGYEPFKGYIYIKR